MITFIYYITVHISSNQYNKNMHRFNNTAVTLTITLSLTRMCSILLESIGSI